MEKNINNPFKVINLPGVISSNTLEMGPLKNKGIKLKIVEMIDITKQPDSNPPFVLKGFLSTT